MRGQCLCVEVAFELDATQLKLYRSEPSAQQFPKLPSLSEFLALMHNA